MSSLSREVSQHLNQVPVAGGPHWSQSRLGRFCFPLKALYWLVIVYSVTNVAPCHTQPAGDRMQCSALEIFLKGVKHPDPLMIALTQHPSNWMSFVVAAATSACSDQARDGLLGQAEGSSDPALRQSGREAEGQALRAGAGERPPGLGGVVEPWIRWPVGFGLS